MDLKDTAKIIRNVVDKNRERNDLYSKIDMAVNCEFHPAKALTDLPFVKGRHYALTDIADARNAGVRTFAVLLPSISVSPIRDTETEYERVERMEDILKWEFQKMNRVDTDTIHSQIIESAINYHSVAIQTQYLPYHYKGKTKTPRIKAALRQKNFNWIVHHPGTIHVDKAKDGSMNGVAKVAEYTLKQLIDEFGMENDGIAKLIKKAGRDKDTAMKTKFKLIDWTDWENRKIWAVQGEINESEFVIMDEPHGLDFIPWVVTDKQNPLWQSVIESGMWDNAQHMNIIRFAKAIEQAASPAGLIQTADGTLKGVWIDPSSPMNYLQIPPGAQYRDLQRPQIDPQLEQHFQEMRAAIQKSTVSQVLTDIGQYSDAPFSTVNQIVQMALGQLAPAKQAAEDAEAKAFYQMFQWIEHSKIPLITYRQEDKTGADGNTLRRGEEIGIWPGQQPQPETVESKAELDAFKRRIYFDLDQLYIKVDMKSQNTADEQARQNVIINSVTHLGASKKWAWEEMGKDNYDLIEEQRASEMLADAEIQKIIAMKQLEVEKARSQIAIEAQMEAQQMQQEQQAQGQSQADMNGQNQALNSDNAFATMQGQDMRGGGNPAAMAAPSMTREQVNGQDANGAEI